MDNLVAKTKKLGLSKAPISLEVDPQAEAQAKLLLLGKVISSRVFSKIVVKEIISKAWNTIKEVGVAVVDKNIFLFTFNHEVDVRRIWDCPWSFKGEHLILKKYASDWSFNEVDFSETDFWVQIHGLPLNRQNIQNLKKLRSLLGTVIEEDLIGNRDGAGKRYVRFKKLGNFCYGCGRIGHDIKDCLDEEVKILWKDKLTDGIFGNWLRAENNDFQPSIDLEGLNSSDMAKCSIMGAPSTSLGIGNIIIRDRQSSWTEAVQTAAEAWHLLRQREDMDQSEAYVSKKVDDGLSELELVRVEARGSNKLTTLVLQSLQIGKDVGSGGPFLTGPGKRKVAELDPEDNPPKKPKGGGPYHAPTSSMRLLSWNCRGAGRALTVRALKALVRVGKSGGLALFWKMGVELEVVYSDNNLIAALVYSDPPKNAWLLLAVYGPPCAANRNHFWSLLENLVNSFSRQWLIIGDLNSVATRSKKKGGSSHGSITSKSFQNFVSNIEALDLGFIGPKFPWFNRRVGWVNVKERLDRGLCNDDWQRLFPKAGIRHLMAPNSDHNPILFDTHLELHKGIKPFRFEAMWKVQKDLVQCNKYFFGATKTQIRELEKKITKIQNLDPTQENLALEASLSTELNEWLEREELKWRQKSRELWLKEGDRNSKFFHLSTIVRRRRNQITEIQLEDESWIHSRDNIADYFAHHFVEKVVWDMNPLKAPGPDGFPGLFFWRYWDIVGYQVIDAVQSFFREGWLLKQMNHTFITLIPKKQVLRLRPLLAKLIDPSQAAFVPDRWIAENVVLAQEVIDSFHKMKRKKGWVGFKLDFKKAYDSIEWNFILVSTIIPSKGLRQGDPLSPYLFILCSDILAKIINREVDRGSIQGVKLNPAASPITKLFYADDVLLFYRAKIREVDVMMKCIEKYCQWSGQSISIEKSGLFVSKGAHKQFMNQVKNQWGYKKLANRVKYLGVPLFLSRNKSADFAYMKDKLEARTNSWKSKNLSWMGQATLIKSVAQACPIYAMSTCKFPKKLCNDLNGVIQKFWWNPRKEGSRSFTPLAWNELCKPLSAGGLGFRSFESFNEAMIAKLAWGIEGVKSTLVKGACRLGGSGVSILVWNDPWIPSLPNFCPHPRDGLLDQQCLSVSQLMNLDKSRWDLDVLKSLFEPDSVRAILNIPRWNPNHPNKWIWVKTTNESVIHLFWDCSLAKALWFGCLDIKTEFFDLTKPSDIVELILFPSDDLKDDPLYCDHFILIGTLILDQIWKARNFKIHDDGQIKVEQIMKNIIMLRFEHRLPPKQSSSSACQRLERKFGFCFD
uniref:CCHC-type domain-containing protein n=1 Tax=Fagus sylvatica TaxID=28930 RepID=A0A2N9IMG3_FAGSY